MKYLTIAIFICCFLLLRPYQMQKLGLCYKGDDFSYFAHATSIAYGQFPSYEKEYYIHGEGRPLHSIGSGIMAAPFVFVFSLIDRIQGNDIIHQRKADNIRHSWSMFGFVVASCTYFWLGCWLLYLTGIRFYPAKFVILSVIVLVIAQGIPLYAFRRPIFAHVYEYFLQCVMVFLLFLPKVGSQRGVGYWFAVAVTLGLMPLVRYNNAVAMMAWWIILIMQNGGFGRLLKNKAVAMSLFLFVLFVGFFFILPIIMHVDSGYLSKFRYFLKPWWLKQYPGRIMNVLFGLSWGLVFTAPYILIGIWAMVRQKFRDKRYLVAATAAMVVNLHIIITYAAQGGYYGYRYFICSIIPLLVVPLAGGIKEAVERYGRKVYLFVGMIVLFPLFSMLCFEGNNTTLTLHIVEVSRGRGYSNHTYQWEVWKTLFTDPIGWAIAVFKGGLLYIVYLAAQVTGLTEHLPQVVRSRYPEFRWDVFIKVMCLYLLPFVLLKICDRKHSGHKDDALCSS